MSKDTLKRLWYFMTRRKTYSDIEINTGNLRRCLTKWDLTAMGVGGTLGVGMYVVTGQVAKDIAGPALVLSFLIAGVVSMFAGLCYAEFSARVPMAGSAYVYTYVCIGEFMAYLVGWTLIFEYLIGSASVVRGLSIYVDSMVNQSMARAFREVAAIDHPRMSEYFDFFAFAAIILLGFALAFGLRFSSTINSCLAAVNVVVIIFIITAGSIKANPSHWSIPAAELPQDVAAGVGGFIPYGFQGVIKGAAVCFYAFVGFETLATTGEEVKEPRTAIPFAILLSISIVFVGYFGVATVLTMMVPYYLQSPQSPLSYAFEFVGWEWARWVVGLGATVGLCARFLHFVRSHVPAAARAVLDGARRTSVPLVWLRGQEEPLAGLRHLSLLGYRRSTGSAVEPGGSSVVDVTRHAAGVRHCGSLRLALKISRRHHDHERACKPIVARTHSSHGECAASTGGPRRESALRAVV